MRESFNAKKAGSEKVPIVRCAMCGKHVTRQMEVRCGDRVYCSAQCAEACEKKS